MARLNRSLFQNQPRAFPMIFMIEVWERFGYYTVQGILALYFIRFLGFSDEMAYHTFGAFFALVYGMVAIGGYLGDHVLGTQRTLILGLLVLALGYLSLALVSKPYVFYALGLICVGNGLFKANPASLLSKCYDDQDPRLHGAFTLYYMAINLGSIAALFIGPQLAKSYGYSYAFFTSFLGILLGLAQYSYQHHHLTLIKTPTDTSPNRPWQWGLVILGIGGATLLSSYLLQNVLMAKYLLTGITLIVLVFYALLMYREQRLSCRRMGLALILMLEAIVFFTLYQQMPTSLNLFAVHNVLSSTIFGLSIDAQSFQALNPIWIITLSPLLAYGYSTLDRLGIVFPIPYKFALGMTCCGISFTLLFGARFVHDPSGMVSVGWLVASYFFQSLGELLVSALGVAMVAELVPKHIGGFVMGMWFLTSSAAGFLGASVASYTALPKTLTPGLDSLFLYTHVFLTIGLVTLGIAACLWCLSPRLTRLLRF